MSNKSDLVCVIKNCNNPRYKNKHLCAFHWRIRRKQDKYKKVNLDDF